MEGLSMTAKAGVGCAHMAAVHSVDEWAGRAEDGERIE